MCSFRTSTCVGPANATVRTEDVVVLLTPVLSNTRRLPTRNAPLATGPVVHAMLRWIYGHEVRLDRSLLLALHATAKV
eukprot:COSAG01_NODE_28865_length_650_cov_474.043557_1_plen_77_part_10